MKFDWIKTIPDYTSYFNDDHRLIIKLIGIDNYLKLYEYFGKTGIYFPARRSPEDIDGSVRRTENGTYNDQDMILQLVGEDNYLKLFAHFGKAGIYFSSSPIISLKKAWAVKNKHVDYNHAARILNVSTKSIYNWRQVE